MFINQVYELTMVPEAEDFQILLDKAKRGSAQIVCDGDYYIDQALTNKGLTVKYRDSTYKKKVILIVNTALVLKEKADDPEKLVRKAEKRVSEYFDAACSLDEFDLSKLTLVADIDVGSRAKALSYVKVLQRIRRVKGFSPAQFGGTDKKFSFCLTGNSNGTDFRIYDFARVLTDWQRCLDVPREDWEPLLKTAQGLLRAEVILNGKGTIRDCTESCIASDQIAELSRRCQEIFFTTFTRIIPPGDFCKMGDAKEMIHCGVDDPRMLWRMLRLIMLIPEKKSLWLAQKTMNYRHIDDVMEAFAKINLSPITISKRADVKSLPSLYSYFV